MHQLLELFGCEYRSGRAAAAPLLRPHDVVCQQGGHLDDDDHNDNSQPTFKVTEVDRPHDGTRLPHEYSLTEIADLFPTITAAAAPLNADDWIPEHARGEDGGSKRDASRFARSGR